MCLDRTAKKITDIFSLNGYAIICDIAVCNETKV
jgi:hypothetical protein